MSTLFTELFQGNVSLDTEKRIELVRGLEEFLVFDNLFAKEEIVPADFASILNKYGWFWVSINADAAKGKSPYAIVVNDVTESIESADAQVKYFDVADGQVKEMNFTDFINWVKQSVVLDEHLGYVAIRLKKAPGEGKIGDLRLMDKESRHLVYVGAIDQILEKYKDNPTFVKAGYGYVEDKQGKKKVQLLLRFKDEMPLDLGNDYQFFSDRHEKEFALSLETSLEADDKVLVTDPEPVTCVPKISKETRINTVRTTVPVLGGTLIQSSSDGGAGTIAGWFRDKTTGKPVILTNQHVVNESGVGLYLLNYEAETDRLGFAPYAFTSGRMGMEKTAIVVDEKDMAIAVAREEKYIPDYLVSDGNKFTWNSNSFFVKGSREPIVGQKVFKIGAATGYTEGEIATYFKMLVDTSKPENAGKANYVVDFKIHNEAGMLTHGDSGSAVISADKNVLTAKHEFIGMIYAAEKPLLPELNCISKSAHALGIDYVCSEMNLEVY